jgi:hypothetical protein
MQESVRQYLSKIGSKGGMQATGDKKRRPKEHYQRIQAISAARRRGKTMSALRAQRDAKTPPVPHLSPRELMAAILKKRKAPEATSEKREKPSLPTFQVRPS